MNKLNILKEVLTELLGLCTLAFIGGAIIKFIELFAGTFLFNIGLAILVLSVALIILEVVTKEIRRSSNRQGI